MEIKIPEEIKVGAHTYKVVFREDLDRNERWRGTSCHSSLKIEIDSYEEGTRLASTFLHEVLHCADKVYNRGDMPEDTIDAIGVGLTQIFKSMGINFVR